MNKEEILHLERKAQRCMDRANELIAYDGKEHEAVQHANNACIIYGTLMEADEERYLAPMVDALLECASIEFMAFEPERSEAHCKRIIDLCTRLGEHFPQEAAAKRNEAYYTLSVAAMMQRDLEKESDALTQLLESCRRLSRYDDDKYSQSYLEALLRLAFCHYKQEQYDKAEAEYVELAQLVERVQTDYMEEPRGMKAQVYEDWGRLLWVQKRLDEAHQKFDVAITVYDQIGCGGRNLARVLEVKARCYQEQGLYEEALRTIEEAISVEPDNADWYDTKGYFLLLGGDEKGAKRMWAKVLEMEPQHLDYGYSCLYETLKERELIKTTD